MARVLAVDDEALSRAVLVDALTELGHEADAVSSGRAALERLDTGLFDAVVSDVIMAGMDGLELVHRCAARHPPVPVVLVSGSQVPERARASAAGFLSKPIDVKQLGEILAPLLAGADPAPLDDDWDGLDALERVAGGIERFPPVRVLFTAWRLGASGVLRVASRGVIGLVGLRGGKVVQVSGVPGLLRTLGPDAPDHRDLAADVAAAVAMGAPADKVFDAAAEGLGGWIAGLVDASEGNVSFDAAWTPPPGSFPLPTTAPRIIVRGLLRVRTDAVVSKAWEGLGSAQMRLRTPDGAPESSWGLDAATTRVLRLAPRASTVDRLLTLASADRPGDAARRAEALRALDTLRALGLLAVDRLREDVAAKVSTPPPPPEPTQEDPREARLARALGELEGAPPLQVLELMNRVRLTEEDVSNAYRDISRRYHPDFFFNAPPQVRSLAESCFSLVNAAYDALRSPNGFAEARRMLEARARGETFVSEKDHLAARVAFRRAEQLFRARDYGAADPLFLEAARLDPGTWPHALCAIRSGWLAKRLPPAAVVAALETLKPKEPVRQGEILTLAGTVLKQAGKVAEAMERFRAAAAADPENRDAQRELRLHESRNPPKPPPPFSGLLNRKKDGGS
jgi:CheY-like chemotaxis protein/tetratricopeptide (TPR) repeat protein